MRIRFGEFCLDEERRELRRGMDSVHLSPNAFDLLCILVTERPRIVSSQTLTDRLWSDTFVGRGSLHNLVSQVRNALGDQAHQVVRTAYGCGFSFDAVTVVEDAHPATSFRIVVGDVVFELCEGENVVGRDWRARVRIDSTSISRRHARIVISGDEATIEDLGSKNGTSVCGRRVRRSVPLAAGDTILFGTITGTFHVLDTPPSTESAVE